MKKKLNKIEEAFETEDFPFEVTCTAFKDKDDIIDEKPKSRYEVGDRFLNEKGETLSLTLISECSSLTKSNFKVWLWGLTNLTTGNFNIIVNDIENCRGLIDDELQSIIHKYLYDNNLRFKHNKL